MLDCLQITFRGVAVLISRCCSATVRGYLVDRICGSLGGTPPPTHHGVASHMKTPLPDLAALRRWFAAPICLFETSMTTERVCFSLAGSV